MTTQLPLSQIDFPHETEKGEQFTLHIEFVFIPESPGYSIGIPEYCHEGSPAEIHFASITTNLTEDLQIEVFPTPELLEEIEAFILEHHKTQTNPYTTKLN